LNKSTVFLSPEQRRVIEKSGKSIQQFYSDLTDMYASHDMDKWRRGHLYHREARMVFMRADNINQLLELLPNPYEAGRKLGEKARETSLVMWDREGVEPTHQEALLSFMSNVSGWGVFAPLKPDKIVLESPALKDEAFVRGFLEGAMTKRLRPVYVDPDRLVFQLVSNSRRK
jgi:hypothetical protein